jgi:hypothetical protein
MRFVPVKTAGQQAALMLPGQRGRLVSKLLTKGCKRSDPESAAEILQAGSRPHMDCRAKAGSR